MDGRGDEMMKRGRMACVKSVEKGDVNWEKGFRS